MENRERKLQLEQLQTKIDFLPKRMIVPERRWIHTIRTALNMSLAQFGAKLNISKNSASEIEKREQSKSITLKSLEAAGNSLGFKLVYGFIPNESSVQDIIKKRATELATEIVLSTSHNMALENQENSDERIKKAIKEKADELQYKLPRYLWD